MSVDLHHVVEGPSDAPVLLLLGSLGSDLSVWEPQRALAGSLRLVRADLRGHGASPVPPGPYALEELADDVVGLLDRLDVDVAHVAGISLGGMVAQAVAVRAPERVRSLALLCTSARTEDPSPWHDRAATVRRDGPGALAATVVGRWLTAPYAAAHPEVAARLRAMVAATPAEGYAGCCEAVAGLDLTAELPRVEAPALVVSAAQDASLPPEHQRRIADLLPRSRLVELEGVAHLASVERADDVARLLRDHVQDAQRR
ncbi:3-oxoadipate enol-lactonase [Vallicoccus soli]|uniref:3-oxoadipate enol-lactonase n=1 Tax=Vallicoccus soli TaxID=2339232 RepID=A0A3A3ZLQ2_9ACTN|nr:3-oxoadipate enol-lactonase [Vallicoccus soli]RJK97142.1 3-oxoadipate enol-lactonase [Vallicoccus soli]